MNNVYLLDTNIASALFDKQCPDHSKALIFTNNAANAGDRIFISRFVVAEIEYGIAIHPNLDTVRTEQLRKSMDSYTSIKELAKWTTPCYADIRAALFNKFGERIAKGKVKKVRPESLIDKTTSQTLSIQENDLWMAAIAVEHNMILVSEDKMSRLKEAYPTLNLQKWK